MPEERPLFIPLRTEFFRAFESGQKDTEFRPYGARWNEHTCREGREVILSLGYGKRERLRGRIESFRASTAPSRLPSWESCYGPGECMVACIRIQLV
jgi:hypothetical protein